MKILIDTHSLLWSLFDPKKLKEKQRTALLDEQNDIYVSAISLWEISLKYSLGKLELELMPDELIPYVEQSGFMQMPLEPMTAASYFQLPRIGHRDPFNRMLIWQAICNDWVFLSSDSQLIPYKKSGLKLLG